MRYLQHIYHLSLKEFTHIIRDKRSFLFLLIMPTLLTIVFGFALGNNSDIKGIKTRVLNLDQEVIAEQYIKSIEGKETFQLDIFNQATTQDLEQAKRDLIKNTIQAIVVLPKGLTTAVKNGTQGQIQAIVDASDTFSAPSVLRELHRVTIEHNMRLAAGYLLLEGLVQTQAQAVLRMAPVELQTELKFNPQLKMQNFTMPGVIGLILQIITVLIMASSIAKERERGTMEQLAVTPLSGAEIFIGKLIPYFLISLFDTVNVMGVARLLFNVSLSKHYVAISLLVVLFILGSLGLGQLISTLSKNQSQATQLAIFYVLPVFVLSGAFAPLETIPQKIRIISYLFPLTYFCRAFRACILRNASLLDIQFDLFFLGGFVLLTFGLSVLMLRYKKA